MPQICDMGQDGFYFPSEEGVLRIFYFRPEEYNVFGRV
jgi:hypothetical protein